MSWDAAVTNGTNWKLAPGSYLHCLETFGSAVLEQKITRKIFSLHIACVCWMGSSLVQISNTVI